MAIVTETVTINGKQFIHTYSDAGRFVVGGEPYGVYSDAYDPEDANRVYAEGELIPVDTSEEAALVRYSNELTGQQDQTLEEATESLIKQIMEE